MSTISTARLVAAALLLLLLSSLNPQLSTCWAQGTAFTYQGRLNSGTNPANGFYDLTFTLFGASGLGLPIAGPVTNSAVVITSGLFTTTVDLGANFPGADRWLRMGVRTNGSGPFTTLTPRQQLTATPYASTANNLSGTLSSTGLSGSYTGAVTFNNASNNFTGSGEGLTALNAGQLSSGQVPSTVLSNAWKTTGNSGTTPGPQFLGTTDNAPLEIKVNGDRALRLEPTPTDADRAGIVNVAGGSLANAVGAGVIGATIAGGGASNWLGVALGNRVDADFGSVGGGCGNIIQTSALESTIGGGVQNTIQASAYYATISGGQNNTIRSNGDNSTIGGGFQNTIQFSAKTATIGGGALNTIQTWAERSTVGGGYQNTIQGYAFGSTIGGGNQNTIQSNAYYATIGGGSSNTVAAGSFYATIPGGYFNTATNQAFAVGTRAKASHKGAFVWGDSTTSVDIESADDDSVTMRAAGGYRLFSNRILTAGVSLAAGGTAWAVISDRNVKKDFAPVDGREVLEKLAAMRVSQWHYQWEQASATPHIGPMAQDFKAAFYPGNDDKTITTQEADGVMFAAMQGLNEKVEANSAKEQARMEKLEAENAQLRLRLEKLETMMNLLIN